MKVALVTAGSGGIGKAIVDKLLADNYYVAVTSRSIDKLKLVFSYVPTSKILYHETDLTDVNSCYEAVERTIQRFGQINLLVNNAGGGTLYQTCEQGTLQSFNDSFDLNVKSTFFMTQYSIPYLIETRGCVINFSSVLGSRPAIGLGPYSAAKAAVEMLTKTAALELAPKGVRVLCIAPTAIQTEFHVNAGMSVEQATKYYETCAKTHPLGRVGNVNDVSELVLFLASSKASYMTGSVIPVDGGRLLTSSSTLPST
jgi:NAD(P)-dependent dehydrogenase (short-subunit alcohol dehydrogenase family)